MDVDELLVAVLGFAAFVVTAPIWTHYLSGFAAQRPAGAFLAALVLPASAALFVTSWVKPELAGTVTGGFLLVAVVVTVPWWLELVELGSQQLADDPLAQTIIQLAVPVLVIAFLVGLGRRRLKAS